MTDRARRWLSFRYSGSIVVDELAPAYFDRLARRVARGELFQGVPRERNHYRVVAVPPEVDVEGYRETSDANPRELRIEAADDTTAACSALCDIRLTRVDARTVRYEVDYTRWFRAFPRVALAILACCAIYWLVAVQMRGPAWSTSAAGMMLSFLGVSMILSTLGERSWSKQALEQMLRAQAHAPEDDDGTPEAAVASAATEVFSSPRIRVAEPAEAKEVDAAVEPTKRRT
jgi:hypothetical protein